MNPNDNQYTMSLTLYQYYGQISKVSVKECMKVGQYKVSRIDGKKAGDVRVEISYHVDPANIVTIKAT